MRDTNKQRVQCQTCGWSGGRAASSQQLDAPCGKCGGPTSPVGVAYVEARVLAGCAGCSWWGERSPSGVRAPCRRCGQPTEPVHVVTLTGTVLA
jgi:ribosomal protein S14